MFSNQFAHLFQNDFYNIHFFETLKHRLLKNKNKNHIQQQFHIKSFKINFKIFDF